MLKNIISQGDYALWSQIALVIFFLTFVGILCWAFSKKSGAHFKYMAQLPGETTSPQEGEQA